jgi:hypothetical protein
MQDDNARSNALCERTGRGPRHGVQEDGGHQPPTPGQLQYGDAQEIEAIITRPEPASPYLGPSYRFH